MRAALSAFALVFAFSSLCVSTADAANAPTVRFPAARCESGSQQGASIELKNGTAFVYEWVNGRRTPRAKFEVLAQAVAPGVVVYSDFKPQGFSLHISCEFNPNTNPATRKSLFTIGGSEKNIRETTCVADIAALCNALKHQPFAR